MIEDIVKMFEELDKNVNELVFDFGNDELRIPLKRKSKNT